MFYDASLRLNQYVDKQIRDAERKVDKMIDLKLGAWRRRFFHRGTRKSRRGPIAYKKPKGKTTKSLHERSIELPSHGDDASTTEDELPDDDDDDGTSTVNNEQSNDGDGATTMEDEPSDDEL
ncbi:hypothetical protein N0V95_000593 [Ascochyta clinopodiicola]|nr:hypothetical protein N0V95_000593 [Ascochyta clinopodiicola]